METERKTEDSRGDQFKLQKPKIRVIHVFTPEIIKTDIANFRGLVQRLTGMPTGDGNKKRKRPIWPPTPNASYKRRRIEVDGDEKKGRTGRHLMWTEGGFGDLGRVVHGFVELPFASMDPCEDHVGFDERAEGSSCEETLRELKDLDAV